MQDRRPLYFVVEVRVRRLGLEAGLGLHHVGVGILVEIRMQLIDFAGDIEGCGAHVLFG